VKSFSEDEIDVLEEHGEYREACEEWEWLRRVTDFYDRYPDVKDLLSPGFLQALRSEDVKVREAMMTGVPFDEIGLPPHGTPLRELRKWSTEDLDVIEYLCWHVFSLLGRMNRVEGTIQRLKPEIEKRSVACRGCGGDLEWAQREDDH
jgi:hypothetical protein